MNDTGKDKQTGRQADRQTEGEERTGAKTLMVTFRVIRLLPSNVKIIFCLNERSNERMNGQEEKCKNMIRLMVKEIFRLRSSCRFPDTNCSKRNIIFCRNVL